MLQAEGGRARARARGLARKPQESQRPGSPPQQAQNPPPRRKLGRARRWAGKIEEPQRPGLPPPQQAQNPPPRRTLGRARRWAGKIEEPQRPGLPPPQQAQDPPAQNGCNKPCIPGATQGVPPVSEQTHRGGANRDYSQDVNSFDSGARDRFLGDLIGQIRMDDKWTQLQKLLSPDIHCRNYQLSKMIACGGFGVVWKGEDAYNAECAIQKMKVPSNPEHILAEITHLKGISHVNFPKFIDSFYAEDRTEIWLVMEYISGMDVYDLIHFLPDCLALKPDQIATISFGIISALQYLHGKKIIHRDVKGENVRVHRLGTVKLMDLGLCTVEGPDSNKIAGTPRFMAPEVIAPKGPYKCNVDIWSLGMTIIQMVTGKMPYQDYDNKKCQDFIINNEMPYIDRPMPSDMSRFLSLCLEYHAKWSPSATDLLRHDYLQSKVPDQALGQIVRIAQCYEAAKEN